jgi:hypothetical protein
MEDDMGRTSWNDWILAASLIRLGQELGHDSKLAHAVADLLSLMSHFHFPTN